MEHLQKKLPKPVIVQPKLQVNEPGDVYEQEADAMANRVMRMKDSDQPQSGADPVTGMIGRSVQRKCAHCEEEEKKNVMRKESGGLTGTAVSSSFSAAIQGGAGNGSPMPAATKDFMENAFNTDFSNVRLHTGADAAVMNNDINARAFTYGNDIYFNHGEFSNDTTAGNKLLAHELTHTIQQSKNTTGTVMRQGRGHGSATASTRPQIISDARRAAMARVSSAYLRINGTSPNFSRADELLTVRGLIAPDIVNFDQIVQIVGSILNKLSSDSNIQVGPEITECTGSMGWNAYVTGNRLPIHLCERFFRLSPEQQVRTLIHEAAHASGIGETVGESYFMYFDCSTSPADNWAVADAWARYIHCISGAAPDVPPPVPTHP